MINKRFAEEQVAITQGVVGDITFDFTTAEVFVELQAKELPDQLVLTFSHPANADADETLLLRRIAGGRYRADLAHKLQGRWYLIVSNSGATEDDNWRVTTELDFNRGHSARFSAHL